MRLWIIISSIVILLFCVPGLLLTLPSPRWLDICVYLLLIALAIHGLHYCKIARLAPARGYPHLAINQLLLGILCSALLVRLSYTLADPALWEQIRQALLGTHNFQFDFLPTLWEQIRQVLLSMLQQMSNGATHNPRQLELLVGEVLGQARHLVTQLLYWVALLTLLSQALFAWMLYRRTHTEPAADAPALDTKD